MAGDAAVVTAHAASRGAMKVQPVLSNLVLQVAGASRPVSTNAGPSTKSPRPSPDPLSERSEQAKIRPRENTKRAPRAADDPVGFAASLRRTQDQADGASQDSDPSSSSERSAAEATARGGDAKTYGRDGESAKPQTKAGVPKSLTSGAGHVAAKSDTTGAESLATDSAQAGGDVPQVRLDPEAPLAQIFGMPAAPNASVAIDQASESALMPTADGMPSAAVPGGPFVDSARNSVVEARSAQAGVQPMQAAVASDPASTVSVERVVYERPLTITALNELLARLDPTLARAGIAASVSQGATATGRADARSFATLREARSAGAGVDSREVAAGATTLPGGQGAAAPVAGDGIAGDLPRSTSGDASGPVRGRASVGNSDAEQDAMPSSERLAISARARESATHGTPASINPSGSNAVAPSVSSSGDRTDPGVRAVPTVGLVGARVAAGTRASSSSPAGPALPATLDAQVTRGVSALLAQGPGSITLRMVPEDLGQLRVHMTMKEGSLSLRFETGNGAARELLDSAVADLRSTLEARGLSVERLSVTIDPSLAEPASARTHMGTDRTNDADTRERLGSQDAGGQDLAGGGSDRGGAGQDARDFAGAFRGNSAGPIAAAGTDARSDEVPTRSVGNGQVTIEFEPGGTGGIGRARIDGVL
jgi:flagellar hook-length control protein FliK